MKVITRIPTGKFSYVELQEETEEKDLDKKIEFLKNVISKHIVEEKSTQNLEVVYSKSKCPDCGNLLIESIGVSSKTNKPYHYIKCINNKGKDSPCQYIQWVDVSEIPQNVEKVL